MPRASHASSKGRKDPYLGKVVAGRYRLEARLGEGGMGIVYRARHVLIDRVVALKLIRPDLRGETHLRAWMLREARAANRVDHAHIVDIHDVGETEEGELYLVMEYLVGTSLSSEIGKGAMPIARAVDIIEQMCAALARAHDLGVVHRDLKSDNIMLTARGGRKDSVKILDFGLAALARDARLAPKGAVFGTPEYMAPEQARGEDATALCDMYALGILFFEMLTGQLPFRSGDRDTLLEMQRSAPPPRPRSIRPDLAPQAEAIILRLLEKDPHRRFRDAHHLQEELKAFQRSLPAAPWELHMGEAPAAPPPPPSTTLTSTSEPSVSNTMSSTAPATGCRKVSEATSTKFALPPGPSASTSRVAPMKSPSWLVWPTALTNAPTLFWSKATVRSPAMSILSSVSVKSVIVSTPMNDVSTNRSSPVPPVRLSLPASPMRTSVLPCPLIVSFCELPTSRSG